MCCCIFIEEYSLGGATWVVFDLDERRIYLFLLEVSSILIMLYIEILVVVDLVDYI